MKHAERRNIAAAILTLSIFSISANEADVSLLRPIPSAAGPDALTVLIYDNEALPYSLLDVRRVVERLTSRVDTRVVAHELESVTAAELASADYIILLGVAPWTKTTSVELLISETGKPVLAIGGAIGAVARVVDSLPVSSSTKRAEFVRGAKLERGDARFSSDMAAVFPVSVRKSTGVEILAVAEWQGKKYTLAGRAGEFFWFSALPIEAATGFVFSDVMLDFYGVESVGASGILCLIDGVRTDGSADALKRTSDLLASQNRAFALSVEMPDPAGDPRTSHALLLGLQYAQARGGRIFLTRSGNAFWNLNADRPVDAAELVEATTQFVAASNWADDNALVPLGVRLPDSGFSEGAAQSLFPKFRIALGIAQASDATASATFVPGTLTQLAPGLVVLPLSLWFQGPRPTSANLDTARNLLRLRGTVLGVSIPAWQPFPETEEFLRTLFDLDVPFLDPVDDLEVVSNPDPVAATPEP